MTLSDKTSICYGGLVSITELNSRKKVVIAPLRTRWHRPLLWLSVAMAALAIFCMVGLLIDPRVLTGAPIWAKPLKFAISIAVYSVTLSWLIGMLQTWRRVVWWAGTVTVAFLMVEMVIIVGDVIAGTTSHFNVSTPLSALMWGVMAVSIVIVWAAALPVMLILARADLGDPARSVAIRTGFVLAMIGMALAFLMTSPTAEQLADYHGIVGAHSVGVADGGPGLPLLGWSTVAGDLRIPHFVGMHALQVLPLVALVLEILSKRVGALRTDAVRARIVWVLAVLFTGVLAVLTGQALAGQSIVNPDAVVVSITAALFVGATGGIAIIVLRERAVLHSTHHSSPQIGSTS